MVQTDYILYAFIWTKQGNITKYLLKSSNLINILQIIGFTEARSMNCSFTKVPEFYILRPYWLSFFVFFSPDKNSNKTFKKTLLLTYKIHSVKSTNLVTAQ